MSIHKRQGDVLQLRRDDLDIETLRAEAKLEAKDRCILAEGEATGHAHRVQEAPKNGQSIEMFMMNGTRLLYVPETFGTVPITHEEHDTVHLEPGVWEIRQQRYFLVRLRLEDAVTRRQEIKHITCDVPFESYWRAVGLMVVETDRRGWRLVQDRVSFSVRAPVRHALIRWSAG
jgi:hypothetical protein